LEDQDLRLAQKMKPKGLEYASRVLSSNPTTTKKKKKE
jgi:hypothetical protein